MSFPHMAGHPAPGRAFEDAVGVGRRGGEGMGVCRTYSAVLWCGVCWGGGWGG